MDKAKVDINNQNESKDAFDTLYFINQILNMFCLTIIRRENKSLIISCSWCKRFLTIGTIICCIIILAYDNVIFFSNKSVRFNFGDLTRLAIATRLIVYIIDLSYVFKFGGHVSLKYFELYEHIDKVLQTNNTIIKTKVLKVTVVLTLFFVTLTAMNIFWVMYDRYDSINTLGSIVGVLLIFINTLTMIEMLAHIILMEYRLKKMKYILQQRYLFTNSTFLKVKNTQQSLKRQNISYLAKCYLYLLEQSHFINKLFGVRVSKK